MREDEIEALCKLHEGRLVVGQRSADGYFYAHVEVGPFFLSTGISSESRIAAVQEAWDRFNKAYKTYKLYIQE